jgi:hypothetical protein
VRVAVYIIITLTVAWQKKKAAMDNCAGKSADPALFAWHFEFASRGFYAADMFNAALHVIAVQIIYRSIKSYYNN